MTQCLIIDGSAPDRRQLADLLAPYDFAVDIAGDGVAALERCRRDMPDLIMVSDRLDGISALDFIRRLRSTHRGLEPVVFICARDADAEAIGTAIWEGATECLMKPFDSDVLDFKLNQFGLVATMAAPVAAMG